MSRKTHKELLSERPKHEKPAEVRERIEHLADNWLAEIDQALEENDESDSRT